MSSYEKLMEMDGDEVYSLAKDKYYTVVIKCNAVYLEEKGRAPFKLFRWAAESMHLCPVYLGPMVKGGIFYEWLLQSCLALAQGK